ncbi:hypothetical protein JRC04_05430 [Mycolicibacterium sp. S2-37]|nr:hypothetical protein [Mycolicibacterium sp. S2-37]MBO0676897.1 hypothetical protein [Mycolicibacterium sp. S2-37]
MTKTLSLLIAALAAVALTACEPETGPPGPYTPMPVIIPMPSGPMVGFI